MTARDGRRPRKKVGLTIHILVRRVANAGVPVYQSTFVSSAVVSKRNQATNTRNLHAKDSRLILTSANKNTIVPWMLLSPCRSSADELSAHSSDSRRITWGIEDRFGRLVNINILVERRAVTQGHSGGGLWVIGVQAVEEEAVNEVDKVRDFEGVRQSVKFLPYPLEESNMISKSAQRNICTYHGGEHHRSGNPGSIQHVLILL